LVAQVFFNVGTTDLNGAGERHRCDAGGALLPFADYLVEGDPHDLATGNNTIVLGKGLADLMESQVGDRCR
jgi:lipoprotein-releasing system permease protein